jgi:hypothetical protein
MRLLLILLAFVVLVPSASGQRRGSISASPDYLLICSENPLPDGYRIVRETFSEGCPQVHYMRRAYVIARPGVEAPAQLAEEVMSPIPDNVPAVQIPAGSSASASADSRLAYLQGELAAMKARDEAKEETARAAAEMERAISNRQVVVGMNYDQVRRSWGNPKTISNAVSARGSSEDWFYVNPRNRRDLIIVSFSKAGLVDYIGN